MAVVLFGVASSLGMIALLGLLVWFCSASSEAIAGALQPLVTSVPSGMPWADRRSSVEHQYYPALLQQHPATHARRQARELYWQPGAWQRVA